VFFMKFLQYLSGGIEFILMNKFDDPAAPEKNKQQNSQSQEKKRGADQSICVHGFSIFPRWFEYK